MHWLLESVEEDTGIDYGPGQNGENVDGEVKQKFCCIYLRVFLITVITIITTVSKVGFIKEKDGRIAENWRFPKLQ